jgi:succinoglycan biosynthesis protein ExoM
MGNSLCRAATCFTDEDPFDPAFGDAGGEDIEFFMRQHIQGRRLVWAPAARVTEVVPEHRTKVAYRLIRARRETQIYVSTYMAHARHPARIHRSMMVKGLIQAVVGAFFALVTLEFGSERRLAGRLLMTKGMGKLSWRKPVGYINETSFKPAKHSA